MVSLIILAVIAVLFFYGISIYNRLVKLRTMVQEAWSSIDVMLKKRHDLIPNLVETVKGYAAHETGVFEKVTEARANALNAQGVEETAKAEGEFEGALKSLFAVAEAYPDLKANQNFAQLQQEQPAGLHYASFKLADGVSFVHIVQIDTTDGSNPLRERAAFQAFAATVQDRCVEPPVSVALHEIGAYKVFAA